MSTNFTPGRISAIRHFLFFIGWFLMVVSLSAQQPKGFISHDVFKTAVFLENNNLMDDYNGEAIRYFSNRDCIKAYFTEKGVLYRLDETKTNGAKSNKDDDAIENESRTAKSSLVDVKWQGANPHPVISVGAKSDGYYTYLKTTGRGYTSLKTVGYKTITYKQLYPGIDVQFSFPEKSGIKYDLIVHPGADLSKVKLLYTGEIMGMAKNAHGEIEIETDAGTLREHAPVSFADNGNKVESSYVLLQANNGNGYTVQFKLPNDYAHDQTLTVDPWMDAINNFATSNCGMDVDFDSLGNTYAYGAGPSSILDASEYYELAKYDVNGVLQWTFSGNIASISWNSFSASNGNTNYAGNIYVDKGTGKIYVSKGHDGTATTVVRLTTAGVYDNFITSTNSNFQEAWGLKYNCTDSTLLAVGGGPSSNINMAVINTNTGFADTANFTHVDSGHQDIAGATFDNFGNLYVVMVKGTPAPNLPYSNTVYRVNSNLRNYVWDAQETHNSLTEEIQQPYWDVAGSSNWINCLAANGSYLYYWDGLYLDAFNLTTGVAAGTTTVLGYILLLKQQGGIAVDNCNNVYVGGDDGVVKTYTFNGSSFTSQADINLTGAFNQDNVQDVKYNSNNNLLYLTGGGADGASFVGTVAASLSGSCSQIAATHTCDSATVHVSPTAGTVFTYTWTDSAGNVVGHVTGSTDTINIIGNLNGGKYYVSVQGQSNCNGSSLVDSVIINKPVVTATPTNAACSGNGSVTATVSGGGIYSYLWSNNQTTQTISVGAGNYSVTVSSSGCTASASATVASTGGGLALSTNSSDAGCISNGTATTSVTAGTGPFTYLWNNNATTQTDSNLAAGNYTVTVTGTGGCTATASVSVSSSGGGLSLSTTSTGAICANNNGTAGVTISTGNPPYSYLWSNGGTHDTINGVPQGTYTVTVTGGGACSATASVSVTSTNPLAVTASATNASCNNNNGTAIADITAGSAPYSYLWNNNATTDTISGLGTGTYTVTVTASGGCTATASATVISSNGITLAAASINTSCGYNNGIAIALVSTGTNPFTYTWSNLATTDTISGLAAGTYTVTAVDANHCSSTASVSVGTSQAPSEVISSNKTIMCSGDSAQICATTAYAVYAWSTGDTTQCITTTDAGNYYVTITDNNQCTAVSNHVNITNYTPTPVTISVNGDTLTSYSAVTYQWYLNGQPLAEDTTDMLIATQAGTYTVTIKDQHGCYYTSSPTNVTGISNIAMTDDISVYPNPLVSGSWHVDISENLIGSRCEVLDVEGRLVYIGELRDRQNEVSLEVAKGIYVMRISYSNETMNIKLIKM